VNKNEQVIKVLLILIHWELFSWLLDGGTFGGGPMV